MTKSKKVFVLASFIALTILLAVAYWPSISSYYVIHDDTVFFLKSETRLDPPGTFALMGRGRHVGAVLFALFGQLVRSIDDLRIIRFLSLVQLCVCGSLMIAWMQKYFSSKVGAFLVMLIALTLPPFQVVVSNTGMCFLPFSVLFAIMAFRLADGLLIDKVFLKTLVSWRIFFAVLFFVAALSTYQPGAMFYWSLFGFWILFSKKQGFREGMIKSGLLLFPAVLGFATYAVILQLTKKYFVQFNLFSYNPYVFSTDYLSKLRWFVAEPVVHMLNLWNIFPKTIYAVGVLALIALGMLVAFLRKAKDAQALSFAEIAGRGCILIALLFLSALPNLVTTADMSLYRCYMALAALITFLIVWSIWQLFPVGHGRKIFFLILIFFSVFGIAQARQTVLKYRVQPSHQETLFFLDAVRQKNLGDYERVYVVLLDEQQFANRGDEYGNFTTFYSHDIVGMFTCALRELSKGFLVIHMMFLDEKSNQVVYVFREARPQGRKYAYRVVVESGMQIKTEDDFLQPTLVINMTKFSSGLPRYYFKNIQENPLKF
ncbi:MAG TPA: hypothetical protein PKO44_03040 [Candidatus Omnitrophota bacterium]|nr:hypothetical protein [Candidatus Omnitrophota bacterium]